MRIAGPVLHRLQIGRIRDWCRFAYVKARVAGTIEASSLPHIEPRVTIRVSRNAKLILGRNTTFRTGCSLHVDASGILEVGDDTALNTGCWVGVTSRISLGSGCLVGPMVTIIDGNHAFDEPAKRIWDQGLETRPIDIGDDVWIGSKATVINSVGDGAVVGANAVVAKAIPAGAIAVGVPAKVQRYRTGYGPAEATYEAIVPDA